MMRRYGLALLLLRSVLGGAPAALRAQEMDVPADIQIPVLFKILTFDRQLADLPPGDAIVIAIVFQTGYRASVLARDQVVDALTLMKDSTISGHSVRWVVVELTSAASLRLALAQDRVDVMYVTPLRGDDLDLITIAARAAGITTFTGVTSYIDRGVALGVGLVRGRARVIVNISAARAEGSDFTAQLLRVSSVVEH